MLFHPLVSKIWARTDQNGTFFDNNWPPSWKCHRDRTGCWTWYRPTPNWKDAILSISIQFCHMPERYKRVLVGWHCAKVKGRVDVYLRPNLKKTVKVGESSRDVTPRSKYDKSEGHIRSPYASNLVQFQLLFTKLQHFEKKWHTLFPLIGRHLESVIWTKPVFEIYLAPSEKRLTYECRSDLSIFVELSCEHCKL